MKINDLTTFFQLFFLEPNINEDFTSPVNKLTTNVNALELNTPDNFTNATTPSCKPTLNPITPLRFSESDEDVEDSNAMYLKTPTCFHDNVADFTPIKTPWRKTSDTSPASSCFSGLDGDEVSVTSFDTNDLLSFTPHGPNAASKGKQTENNGSSYVEPRDEKIKSKLDMFLENNRELLKGMTVSSQAVHNMSLDKMKKSALGFAMDEDEHNTPVNNSFEETHQDHTTPVNQQKAPRQNLINFITPFKSPYTTSPPTSARDTSYVTSDKMNISAEDVDEFIHKVITNTTGRTPKGNLLVVSHLIV